MFYIARLLKLQPKTDFTGQGIFHISPSNNLISRTHEERKASLLTVDQRSKAYG